MMGMIARTRTLIAATTWLSLVMTTSALVLSHTPTHAQSHAQTQTAPRKSSGRMGAVPAPAPTSGTSAASAASASSNAAYRIAARATWIVDPADLEAAPAAPTVAKGSTRREMLLDLQSNHALPKTQFYARVRVAATDAAALPSVSQPQIQFNPAYQTVVLHEAALWRQGRKLDRLQGVRLEVMRREANLERLVIDGTQTLMAVLPDVQLGDVVEVAYTIEGENPIFEGRIGHVLDLASQDPVDHLHLRLVAPRGRQLHTRLLSTTIEPERLVEGDTQVLRIVRRHVPAVVAESNTPPWFKVFPSVQVSEYANWAEVDQWAQKLFAPSQEAGPKVQQKIAELKASGLQAEALVSETLRFVQDEIRYFSASLGVSSHRPKAAEDTLAQRLGDCKDKTILLTTMLNALGFDAKPALVSMFRNRGLASYWPGHEQFDHVITRAVVGGTTYWLDATVNGQGTTLASRGQYPFGLALVVGGRGELEPVIHASTHPLRIDYAQRWDFSRIDAPATMLATMTVTGTSAERWRATAAASTPQQVADVLAGAHARALPGLKLVGEPRIDDDRGTNIFKLSVNFEYDASRAYSNGGLDLEFTAFEMGEALIGPGESTRRTPYLLDVPRQASSSIEVIAPRPFSPNTPAPQEVQDRHFSFSVKALSTGSRYVYTRKYERRSDEVAATNLQAYRESLQRARALVSHNQRLLLVDPKSLSPAFETATRKLASDGIHEDDELGKMITRHTYRRTVDTHVLKLAPAGSNLAARVQASLAASSLTLGDFAAARDHAQQALAIQPQDDESREHLAAGLVGLGRLDEAMAHLQELSRGSRRLAALVLMADVELHRGRAPEAEALLLEVIANADGDTQSRAMLKLYLAAEQQGSGRGKTTLASQLVAADTTQLHGALLHYLDGRIDREALLRRASEDKASERLNLAEAYYYIGAQLAARGQVTTRWSGTKSQLRQGQCRRANSRLQRLR